MAQGKKSFVLYSDLMEIVHDLTDEEAGKLIKTIVDYVNDKNPEVKDRIISVAFKPIKNSLKADLKRWEDIKEKRSDFGRKGGLAKASKSKQMPQVAKQNLANVAVSVSVSDSVINKESHNEIFKKISTSDAWIESVSMNFKSNKRDILTHLEKFRIECLSKDQFKESEKDAKNHFVNWVKKGNPIQSRGAGIILESPRLNRNPE